MGQILIVEDNPDILEAISDLLEGEGYAVTKALSAEDAITLLWDKATPRFDCLILDNFMPGLNGQEFLERLIAPDCPLGRLPPVLMTTTNPEIIQAAHLPMAVALLPKPLDVQQLIVAVEELCRQENENP